MITEFRGQYAFLSNFYPVDVVLSNEIAPGELRPILYPTVEHAYQAAKSQRFTERLQIRNAQTPGQAKRMGRTVTLRPDWESVKNKVMLSLLQQKFAPVERPYTAPLHELLLATGDQRIIEGNTWGDKYWGMVMQNGEWVGQNNLGKMLMDIRRELKVSRLY